MSTTDELINDYLKELDRELSALPRAARLEVVQEISTHIAETRAGLATDNEAEIRAVLDRLGDPADIAAEARERFGVQTRRRSWVEVTALVLLSIGSVVVPILGWLAGVILLWVSDVWSTRDKLLGTIIVPGGLGVPFWLAQTITVSSEACVGSYDEQGRLISQTCSGGPSDFERFFWPTLLIGLLVGCIATTIYLVVRLRRLSRRAVLA
jgi:HAAS domain-containing protein